MAQGETVKVPYEHGQESGFGSLEQTPQDPSQLAGYQQIEEDSVSRVPRNRLWKVVRAIPLPLLLIAGVAIPLFILRRRSR
ncbi:MAG: hypothetical protein WEB00_09070 [Dehalococcoidia bacterium]